MRNGVKHCADVSVDRPSLPLLQCMQLLKRHFCLCVVSTGNAESLQVAPKKAGIDIYQRLREFHQQVYSAGHMSLAVQSRRKLYV